MNLPLSQGDKAEVGTSNGANCGQFRQMSFTLYKQKLNKIDDP